MQCLFLSLMQDLSPMDSVNKIETQMEHYFAIKGSWKINESKRNEGNAVQMFPLPLVQIRSPPQLFSMQIFEVLENNLKHWHRSILSYETCDCCACVLVTILTSLSWSAAICSLALISSPMMTSDNTDHLPSWKLTGIEKTTPAGRLYCPAERPRENRY